MQQTFMGLYVHIPFCMSKCNYCDFLSARATPEIRERYVKALCKEIKTGLGKQTGQKEIDTIFFGGGTPSILSGEQTRRIMDAIQSTYHVRKEAEISLEANPGTVTKEALSAYREAGINRLSFGLQSALNEELRMLGRIHTWEDFCDSYQMSREAGFSNINVDLMSALPGQTLNTWLHTLECVLALKPEHISAYSLIIEEGTPFYGIYGEDRANRDIIRDGFAYPPLPDEDTERQMYEDTEKYLNRQGLYRYEISNYARPGYECRHNSSYWRRIPYLGVGLGASSLIDEKRWNNITDLKEYLAVFECEDKTVLEKKKKLSVVDEITPLSLEDQMSEFLFLGLRMTEGVREADFSEHFGVSLEEKYGTILHRQEQLGLILRKDGWLRLTPYGRDVSNQVFCEYL